MVRLFGRVQTCQWSPPAKRREGTIVKYILFVFVASIAALDQSALAQKVYSDGRPSVLRRMDATDDGIVLKHGDGPDKCDIQGARDIWIFQSGDTFYMHYDGAGPRAWLACLATSTDLVHWEKKGPVLQLGKPEEEDSASASYGTTFLDDAGVWHMFYLGTPHAHPPGYIPAFPYLTMKAKANSPLGPWIKQPGVIPFRPTPGTYYATTASPGQIIKHGDEYLMFFSASTDNPTKRTIGIARTKNLDRSWKVDAEPIVPLTEQIENTSLYFEPTNQTWFLFTNHIGIDAQHQEYTDAVWVYWSKDLEHWSVEDKAVVLDGDNCSWSHACIGLPGVIKLKDRLAVIYDAPGGNSISHMNRDVGLAWLKLPLEVPVAKKDLINH
jgi:predicted GH43/DUF377 family glycosyl hydrolase